MTQQIDNAAIRRTLTAPTSVERAFEQFTYGMASWWPPEYTWAGDVLETIGMEPQMNGRCFERGPHNFTCDWGRVVAWEPPYRVAFTWQISPNRQPEPDPAKASDVEVRFIVEGASTTRVEFEHRNFQRHGEGALEYFRALDSSRGWTYILDSYMEAVA